MPHAKHVHPTSSVFPRHARRLLPLVLALGLGGCASQDFVRQEVKRYDDRVQGMESWFKAIELGLDTQARRIREAELRADRLQQEAAEHAAVLRETRSELAAQTQRTQTLAGEQAANARRLDDLGRQTTAVLAGLEPRLQTAALEATRAHQRLDAQEARLQAGEQRTAAALASLASADQRLASLEKQAAAGAQSAVATPEPAARADVQVSPVPAQPPVAAPAISATAAAPAADVHAAALQGQLQELQGRLERQHLHLAQLGERLRGVEAGLAEQSRGGADRQAVLQAGMQETQATLHDLRADLARLRGESEAMARSLARIDQRVNGLDQDLASARQRVEAGEKVLADSGLRLTLVQELVNRQGERLTQSETAYGQVSLTAREALERAMQAGRLAEGKIVYEATLTDEVTHFALNDARLNAEARKQLDEFAARLKAENRGAFIEIQGHTDNLGAVEANQRLAQRRAMAVRDHLHQEAGIPLNLLAVVAYGPSRPVADNATREGRAKNRRVVLVVLR